VGIYVSMTESPVGGALGVVIRVCPGRFRVMEEVCRVAVRRVTLRTVPPEVARSGTETYGPHVSHLKSICSHFATPNDSSFRRPSRFPGSLAVRRGGDIPKATERSRTRPRLSMPVMGLTGMLKVFAGVIGFGVDCGLV
jgi:hypothetical protein